MECEVGDCQQREVVLMRKTLWFGRWVGVNNTERIKCYDVLALLALVRARNE